MSDSKDQRPVPLEKLTRLGDKSNSHKGENEEDSDDDLITEEEYYRRQTERQDRIMEELKEKMDIKGRGDGAKELEPPGPSGQDIESVTSPILCGADGLHARKSVCGGYRDPLRELTCVVCELRIEHDEVNPGEQLQRCAGCGAAMHVSCGESVTREGDSAAQIYCSSYCCH